MTAGRSESCADAALLRIAPRTLLTLVAIALVWRLFLSALTPVPSEDGVTYLWMAQQFGRGDWRSPLCEVFPPLLPLLMAPFVDVASTWQGGPLVAEATTARGGIAGGQFALSLLGALAVVPIAQVAARLAPAAPRPAALAAGILAALPALPARYCAEVYTEPVFAGAIAAGVGAGLRGRFWRLGAWSGVAFWLRSEALVLPLAWIACRPRSAWRATLPVAAAVGLLALLRSVAGAGFDPLPKLAFNLPKSALGGGASEFAASLAHLPGAWLEAFGLAGILAVFGFWRERNVRAARPLLVALALALVVVVAFAVRRRFLVAWWPLVVAFAALAIADLRRGSRAALLAAAVAIAIITGLHTTDADRIAERDVGRWLGRRLQPARDVVTDLTRVRFFAGLRPLPPRHVEAAELIAAARAPAAQFLVLGSRRPAAAEVIAALPEYRPLPLPPDLAALAAERGLDVRAR